MCARRLIAVDVGNSALKAGLFVLDEDGEVGQPKSVVRLEVVDDLDLLQRQLSQSSHRWCVVSVNRSDEGRLAGWVRDHERFELAVEPPLNLVCFRHKGGDALNQALMDALNASGELFMTHTRMAKKLTLRLSVGQTQTEVRHVVAAWEKIQSVATELEAA